MPTFSNALIRTAPFALLFLLVFSACELPKSPDFKVERSLTLPILNSRTLQLMGEKGALIDTTSENFPDSLFIFDQQDKTISLYKEQEFDFGDLDDAIPAIDADGQEFNSTVGPIEIGSFSSGGGSSVLGSASYQQITGLDPSTAPAGTLIPAGFTPTPIDIAVSTDYFISATILTGALELNVRNNLGFDIAQISIALNSDGVEVGSTTLENFLHSSSRSASIPLQEDDVLRNLSVEIDLSWDPQTSVADAGNVDVINVVGVDMQAKSVQAVLPSQSFSDNGSVSMDQAEFQFTSANHYIELSAATMSITDIVNDLDVDVTNFTMSFPTIRTSPYGAGDTLAIVFEGQNAIFANTNNPVGRRIDLSGSRLFALNNIIPYNISAVTKDYQAEGQFRSSVINSTDAVSANIQITGIEIGRAVGIVQNRQFTLGTDDPSNGDLLDLSNEQERQSVEFDLGDLADQISGLKFVDASLSLEYTTNIGIEAGMLVAFMGIDSDGNEFYLKPKDDSSPLNPDAGDPVSRLVKDGQPIAAENVVKFGIDRVTEGQETITSAIVFDSTTSNITDFLSNLPVELRFVGLADFNPGNEEGILINPVVFETKSIIDIPLNIKTLEAATYSDTLEADFSDLPSQEDEAYIENGAINIRYSNALPLAFRVNLTMLDEVDEVVTRIPTEDGQDLEIVAADVNSSGFVSQAGNGVLSIELTKAQLDVLNSTRKVLLNLELETSQLRAVRLRTTDSITLGIDASVSVVSQ